MVFDLSSVRTPHPGRGARDCRTGSELGWWREASTDGWCTRTVVVANEHAQPSSVFHVEHVQVREAPEARADCHHGTGGVDSRGSQINTARARYAESLAIEPTRAGRCSTWNTEEPCDARA